MQLELSQPSVRSDALSIASQDTVLVVDDTPENLLLLCDLLGEQNYQVAVATNGEDAISRARDVLPDLILLDVMMPGIDGFETCLQLKADPKTRHIPVLFMTALSDTVNKVHGLNVGAVDYVTKPFDHVETLARINVHLSLCKAQAGLVQKEKMAALGCLVAGIAHEINNPVSFIHGNLLPAQNYVESLLSLCQLYEQHVEMPPSIADYMEEIEFEFVQSDAVRLLASMRSGTERIRDIVKALRTFACLDESDYKEANLHDGLDSALALVQHRLRSPSDSPTARPEIHLVKSYGELPLLRCYPRKLNDVFLSLISNAIDAMEQKCRGLPPEQQSKAMMALTLDTAVRDDRIVIEVADSGVGIAKDIHRKIFDQFFTTKPVGKGIGLGLAVALAVVTEDHQGQLTFRSEVGKGSVFTVSLPINKTQR
ncbi:MAG: response regulator [Cyanobacteria bacterium P01_D01_bin.36]